MTPDRSWSRRDAHRQFCPPVPGISVPRSPAFPLSVVSASQEDSDQVERGLAD